MGKVTGAYKCFTDKVYTHIDHDSEALVAIETDHARIHAGETFFYVDYYTVANSGVLDFVLECGAKEVHYVFGISSDMAGFTLSTYEGVTVTDATGSVLNVNNQNRESNNIPTAILKLNPTVQAITTELLLRRTKIGQGGAPSSRVGGSVSRGSEVVLKANTKYLLRITNLSTSNNDINVSMQWYEV